ncbi:MAG: pyridoxamine 5'-phosphate oxidase family protein [Candidatus Aureabacteria bacterium]|nr:pyridoxamine 5'-phosphate oxidase family protein [Candidatus Auribacterota bacterium]
MRKRLQSLLKNKEFLFMATSDRDGRPNVAPKFLLKITRNVIYMVDYSISKTWENLKVNPLVSLATLNNDTLTGYRIDGIAHIVDKGTAYARMLKELHKKEIGFTASRVIEGIHTGKKSGAFEIAFPEHVAIYKITAHMASEIGPRGTVMGERL